MSTNIPAATLTILGVLVVLLGLFAAGSLFLTVVGLAAVFAAGVLQVVTARRT